MAVEARGARAVEEEVGGGRTVDVRRREAVEPLEDAVGKGEEVDRERVNWLALKRVEQEAAEFAPARVPRVAGEVVKEEDDKITKWNIRRAEAYASEGHEKGPPGCLCDVRGTCDPCVEKHGGERPWVVWSMEADG
jgi:hypothetical protein